MLRLTAGALCERGPAVPVTTRLELAAGVALVVATVIVEVATPLVTVIVAGLKVAVAPEGRPETVGVTVPVKPLRGFTLTV